MCASGGGQIKRKVERGKNPKGRMTSNWTYVREISLNSRIKQARKLRNSSTNRGNPFIKLNMRERKKSPSRRRRIRD